MKYLRQKRKRIKNGKSKATKEHNMKISTYDETWYGS
jgi:hypothetical protein